MKTRTESKVLTKCFVVTCCLREVRFHTNCSVVLLMSWQSPPSRVSSEASLEEEVDAFLFGDDPDIMLLEPRSPEDATSGDPDGTRSNRPKSPTCRELSPSAWNYSHVWATTGDPFPTRPGDHEEDDLHGQAEVPHLRRRTRLPRRRRRRPRGRPGNGGRDRPGELLQPQRVLPLPPPQFQVQIPMDPDQPSDWTIQVRLPVCRGHRPRVTLQLLPVPCNSDLCHHHHRLPRDPTQPRPIGQR